MIHSAGIFLIRTKNGKREIFLVHPGGPYYEGTDNDSWGIPKGEIDYGSPLETAKREFKEETGFDAPEKLIELGKFKIRSSKDLTVFVGEGDIDTSLCHSNTCDIFYQGKPMVIHENDAWSWFDFETAMKKLNFGQKQILTFFMELPK